MKRSRVKGWVRRPPGHADRFEACFSGAPFSSHRHDTYVFCLTMSGVQSFDYRGATRHSLADGVIVLHPDERHDGRSGTEAPFRYRAINVAPARLQAVLGGAPLPHIPGGTSNDPRLASAVRALLEDFDRPLDGLEYDDGLFALSTALSAVSDSPRRRSGRPDYRAAERARAFIDAQPEEAITMDDLERVSDRDRWQLSRDFRAAYGTSPYRYAVLRRLEKAKAQLERGIPGTRVAADCGFSDQSHFIRQFRQTYGLAPSDWCALVQ